MKEPNCFKDLKDLLPQFMNELLIKMKEREATVKQKIPNQEYNK